MAPHQTNQSCCLSSGKTERRSCQESCSQPYGKNQHERMNLVCRKTQESQSEQENGACTATLPCSRKLWYSALYQPFSWVRMLINAPFCLSYFRTGFGHLQSKKRWPIYFPSWALAFSPKSSQCVIHKFVININYFTILKMVVQYQFLSCQCKDLHHPFEDCPN